MHPSSGVLKTVSATSGVRHGNGTVTSFLLGLIRTGVSESCGMSTRLAHTSPNVCILLHRVGPLLTSNHDARNHVFKKGSEGVYFFGNNFGVEICAVSSDVM